MDPENDATNQAAADDVHVESPAGVETETDQTLEPIDGELDPESAGNQDPPSDELEEIERGGKTYRIPKDLKSEFMMNADYTRKTQELAEQRRAVESREAEITQQAEVQREFIRDYAKFERIGEQIASLEAQYAEHDATIAELGNTDWDVWQQTNPTAARAAWTRYQAALHGSQKVQVDIRRAERDRDTLKSELQAKQSERISNAQREHAKRLEEAHAELARDLKDDWSPEGQRKLMEFGQSMGFSAEELSSITDPRAIKVLHAAWKAQRQAQTAAARATLQAQQAAKPVPHVGGSAPAGKDPSRMSTAEWMRWRDQQTQKARKAR